MKEIDRIVPEEYNVSVESLMENAGYQVADFMRETFSQDIKIAFICGKGSNGADGLVAARRLIGWGFNIHVYTPFDVEELSRRMRGKLEAIEDLDGDIISMDFPSANIYVDALVGYGLKGKLREPVKGTAENITDWSAKTVSLDVPTGLDIGEGVIHDEAIRPDFTVTLGAIKENMTRQNSGEIHIVDIGIPIEAWKEVGLQAPDFSEDSAIRID